MRLPTLIISLVAACGLFAVLAVPVAAQVSTPAYIAGYEYPPGGVACSPLCTGVSASIVVPTLTANWALYEWIGIYDGVGSGNCPTGCLGQIGLLANRSSSITTYTTWWEIACSSGNPPCGPTQNQSLSVSVGDSLTMTMLCTANCTPGNASQTWQLTIVDNTTGGSWSLSETIPTQVSSVRFAYEIIDGETPSFVNPIRWSGLKVMQNGIWSPVPIVAAGLLYTTTNTGPQASVNPSPPLGPNQNDFNLCYASGASSYVPCPISSYPNGVSMGP
jgi:hypothetical protein